jgi:hypothetical protein
MPDSEPRRERIGEAERRNRGIRRRGVHRVPHLRAGLSRRKGANGRWQARVVRCGPMSRLLCLSQFLPPGINPGQVQVVFEIVHRAKRKVPPSRYYSERRCRAESAGGLSRRLHSVLFPVFSLLGRSAAACPQELLVVLYDGWHIDQGARFHHKSAGDLVAAAVVAGR